MEITDFIVRIQCMGKVAVLNKPVYESSRRLKNWGFLKKPHVLVEELPALLPAQKVVRKIYPTVR